MGEIRIKSGNLYPILIGEDRFYSNNGGVVHNVDGELVVEMGTQIESGAYSYVTNESTLLRVHNELDHGSWSVEIKADTNFTLEIGFREDGRRNVSVTDEYQRFTFDNITFVASKAFTIYNRTGVAHTVYLRNFMLNEGSTALPYQPYFLNRPAHQFINGEWIDIPTHHFINGRWQGELTSQSPLKFRADGEMLDWRVEGRTSGNLFDISTDLIPHLGFSSSSGGIVSIKSTNNAIGFYVKCQPDKYYTLSRATNVNNRFSMGFTADEPVDGTSLLSYTPFETSDTSITALSPSNANYLCAYLTNQNDPITDDLQLMLNEGSTALPYEPYGGVGDWDETEQKYRIPVKIEGENLFDGEWKQGTTQYPTTYNRTSSKNIIDISPEAKYTIALSGSSVIQFALVYHDAEGNTVYDSGWKDITVSPLAPNKDGATSADILLRRNDNGAISPDSEEVQNLKVQLYEGTYTASTIPPYEVSIFTDHQLMDGDSIDYTITETTIPLATGNNTLTVDTAVKPKSVFVKFEG